MFKALDSNYLPLSREINQFACLPGLHIKILKFARLTLYYSNLWPNLFISYLHRIFCIYRYVAPGFCKGTSKRTPSKCVCGEGGGCIHIHIHICIYVYVRIAEDKHI